MAVPEEVKDLLKCIRQRLEFVRPMAERVAATELKSLQADFESLLERLPDDLGGKKTEDWATLVAQDAQLKDDVEALEKRFQEHAQFVLGQDLAQKPASFGKQLGVVIYAAACIVALLVCIGLFWSRGSAPFVKTSRAEVSRLKEDTRIARDKAQAANKRLAEVEGEHTAANQVVIKAVKDGVAKLKQPGETDTTTEGPEETEEAAAEESAESSSTDEEDNPAATPEGTPTALPADDDTPDAPPAPTEVAEEESPSDADTAEQADAAQGTDDATRVDALTQDTLLTLTAAQFIQEIKQTAEEANEKVAASATTTQKTFADAAAAMEEKQKAVTEAFEAPLEVAESARDAVEEKIKSAKEKAEAAADEEKAAAGEEATAQEKLAVDERRAFPFSFWVLFMCALFGALGACLRLAGSLGAYIAGRQLYSSWLVYYYSMPFEGVLMGIAIYLVFGAGLFTPDTGGTDAASLGNPLYIYALAMLAGTFSKNAMQKLRDIADAAFGKPSNKDALSP